MKRFIWVVWMLVFASVPALAASFSLKGGVFNPSGDLKNATDSSWWSGALEYNLYKLPLASVNLEVAYSRESGASGTNPTEVTIIPVSLNYMMRMGMSSAFGAGIGLYNVRSELGTSEQTESALGFNIFVRQYYANIFLETKYQFADADIQPEFGSQNGIYFFLGIEL